MTRAFTVRKQRFLPYAFVDHGLGFSVQQCRLDGDRDVTAAYDAERRVLELSSSRWSTARVRVEVSLGADLVESLFSPEERTAPPGRLMVIVTCSATRIRRAVALGEARLSVGMSAGEVTLVRSELQGAVELTPVLIRSTGRDAADDGFADATGSRLATGATVEIRVDEVRSPTGEYLDIRYESFRESGPPRFPHPASMYQLDCDGDAPVLWINLDHAKVCSVLDGGGTVGRVARLRDVLFGQISYGVWSRLFWRAARDLQRAGEPVHEWQRAVLARLLPAIYPETLDADSRLEALREDLDDDSDEIVLARLDGALQEHLDFGGRATNLTEELA